MTGKDWQRTQFANLIRYVPSGTYYARLRGVGKLVRKRLKTDAFSIPKLRLAVFDKLERQRPESTAAGACGTVAVGDAIEMHRQQVAGDGSLKPRTRDYHDQRITALLKTWPGLAGYVEFHING